MAKSNNHMATDLGLLALRVTTGGLMAGHGAQKLFGAFGGYGLQGTGGWLESMGMKPGKLWAAMAGGSEFGGGVLTALGFLNPVGPITSIAPMVMAWTTAHAGKPIWVTSGGAELPLTNIAAFAALGMAGPGRYSLDDVLDLEVPMPVIGLVAAGAAAGIAAGLLMRRETPEPVESQAGGQLQAGEDAGPHGVETELATDVAGPALAPEEHELISREVGA